MSRLAESTKALVYDVAGLRFVDDGAPIPDDRVRAIWSNALERAADKMQTTMLSLARGEITEAEAALALRPLVKALHMGGLAVGTGGRTQVTARDLRRIGPVLRDEYRHLRRRLSSFTAYQEYLAGGGLPEAYTGQRVTPAQLVASVPGYAKRARGTMETARVWAARRAGHTEVRRILRHGKNCHKTGRTPGCVEQAGRKWHSIDTFVPIGNCACRSECNCIVETRRRPARGRAA